MAQQYIICIIQLYQTAEVLRTSFLVYAIGVALRFPSFQKFVLSNCQSQRRQISWWWFSHQVANFHPRKKRNKPRDFLFDYRAIPHFNLLTEKNFHQENSLSLSLSLSLSPCVSLKKRSDSWRLLINQRTKLLFFYSRTIKTNFPVLPYILNKQLILANISDAHAQRMKEL